METTYQIPNPILNQKEADALDTLTAKYDKITKPSTLAKIGTNAKKLIPQKVKDWSAEIGHTITEQELYTQMMNVLGKGFETLEEQAAKTTISEKQILNRLNKASSEEIQIDNLEEICLLRSYDIAKAVNVYRTQDISVAAIEGGATSVFGFWGLPFNLVLSTFLFFRAVQSIAMFYGYDVKNDNAELIIAAEVFSGSLSPAKSTTNNEISAVILKVMGMGQLAAIEKTITKGWTEMAMRGGIPLLLTQIRALAHKAAKKALENAGKKGLENSIFREVLEQIGAKLTQKAISKSIPFVSLAFGALIDAAQMKKILEYADIFYQKRFIMEKAERIHQLTNPNDIIILEDDDAASNNSDNSNTDNI